MRFTKMTLLAASVALAACGGEPPEDNAPPAVFDPIIDEGETGIGEKPADPPALCATADTTMTGEPVRVRRSPIAGWFTGLHSRRPRCLRRWRSPHCC